MATTTYSTNDSIRGSYPSIDDRLMHGITNAEHVGEITVLDVVDTVGFPFSGTVYAIDDLNELATMPYSRKTSGAFILTAAQTLTSKIIQGSEVFLGDALFDSWRAKGKGFVDANITNSNFPVAEKARIEEAFVFYMACFQSQDANTRQHGTDVLTAVMSSIAASMKLYPPAMTQTICKLVEDNLSAEDIEELKWGINGDQ